MQVPTTHCRRSDPHFQPMMAALVPCFLGTVVLGLLSNGVYHDDDLTHFLMARWAHWFPAYLLHIWGRPGLTLPLAAVAWIGDADVAWHAARCLSAIVTAASALLAARLAARLGVRNAWLVIPACYLQPLNALLACTTLTENFAAFYLIAALSLLYAGRRLPASAVFSLILLTRHEAVVLLPIWWLALAAGPAPARRRLLAGVLALWAPAVHNLLFRWVLGGWPIAMFLEPHGSTEYPAAGLLGYLPHALLALPPAIAGLALLGAITFARHGRLLIPAIAGLFLVTHVAVTASGVYASGGYGRFMVGIAPLVAILAVVGLNEIAAQSRDRRPSRAGWLVLALVWPVGWVAFELERRAGRIPLHDTRWAGWLGAAAGLVVVLILAAWAATSRAPPRRGKAAWFPRAAAAALASTCAIQWACVVRPLHLRENEQQVCRVIDWLRARHLDDAPLFAANPWFAYRLNLIEDPRAHKDPELLASMPVGTVFVWDSIYSDSDYHRLPLKMFENNRCYELLQPFEGTGPRGADMVVFRKIAETPAPDGSQASYPRHLMSEEQPVLGVYYVRPGDP